MEMPPFSFKDMPNLLSVYLFTIAQFRHVMAPFRVSKSKRNRNKMSRNVFLYTGWALPDRCHAFFKTSDLHHVYMVFLHPEKCLYGSRSFGSWKRIFLNYYLLKTPTSFVIQSERQSMVQRPKQLRTTMGCSLFSF